MFGCLGVVFSVLVAVAREGPTTRRGRSICSMALPGGNPREQPAHTWSLGSPALQIFQTDGNGTGGTETNSHRRVEGGKLLKKLGRF